MKNKATKLFAAATLTMAFTVTADTTEATANTEGSEEVVALDETVFQGETLYTDQVTALKTPTPIIDVPQSVSITTAEDISLRGFDNIGDIVDYTPGVNKSQGEGHRDAVVFRGVRSTADFFVDGVRDDVQYYRPLYNVEQVEILRGPNALFFGRGGAGGILNRVTKKGAIGENFNNYSLSLDTIGGSMAQWDSNVAINEKSAFRLNAYYEEYGSDRDYYDGDGYGVNPTMKFLLTEQTTLDVSYEYIDYDRFIDRGIPTSDDGNGEPVDALNDEVFASRDQNESEFEAHIFRSALQHKFSDTLKANISATYGDYDKRYQNFYASGYDDVASPDKVTLSGYVDTTERQTFTLSSSLIGEFETGDIGHTVVFGAEYIDTDNDNTRMKADSQEILIAELGAFSAPFDNFGDDTEATIETTSFYIQDIIELTEQWTFVLGLRYDDIDFDVDVYDELGGKESRSQSDDEVTPRVGIVFKPKENISIYASYSETFLPQSGEQFASVGDGSQDLDPNEFSNLEAGVNWNFAQDFSLRTAIFQIEQDLVEDNGSGGSDRNDTDIEGFEAELKGKITDRWFISAGYTYLTGELDNGNTPRELPENMISIWNHYQVTDKLGLGLGAIYQDSSYVTNSETAELPDFVRVDAAAYYQINETLRLQVNIENLLDEEYYPSAHSTHQATVGEPINARFAIVGSF